MNIDNWAKTKWEEEAEREISNQRTSTCQLRFEVHPLMTKELRKTYLFWVLGKNTCFVLNFVELKQCQRPALGAIINAIIQQRHTHNSRIKND